MLDNCSSGSSSTQNIYGGNFQQTLFLGLSVSSFSSELGLNGTSSSVTVRLVEDPCSSETGKVYYDRDLNRHATDTISKGFNPWYDPDPGFTYPTIGSAVYFRIGNFEFTGLLQSYERQISESGDVFVVKIVDPLEILNGVAIIIGDYAGGVLGIPNLINVFGYAESFGTPCEFFEQGGAAFGSPAGGFGGADTTDNGMSWNLIRQCIHTLCSSPIFPPVFGQSGNVWSPYGRIVFRGTCQHEYVDDQGHTVKDGFGTIVADAGPDIKTNGNDPYLWVNYYLIDLSDLPAAPNFWRLSGPSMSLTDIITEVCDDAGCDWYVELLPAIHMGRVQKIIKVRSIARNKQPEIGQIERFLQGDFAAAGSISNNVGLELRNEVTGSMVTGGPVETIYQSLKVSDDPSVYLIEPYWGLDYWGNVIPTVTATINNGEGEGEEIANKPVIGFFVDITALNASLFNDLNVNTIFITVDELSAAIKDQDSWMTWISQITRLIHDDSASIVETFNGNSLGTARIDTFGSVIGNKAGIFDFPIVGGLLQAFVNDVMPFDMAAFCPLKKPIVPPGMAAAFAAAGNKEIAIEKDLKTIYSFVRRYAEMAGREFMVKMPYTAVRQEESLKIVTSEQPNESGWIPDATTDVLGLPANSVLMDFFSEENGKIKCFAGFNNLDSKDLSEANAPDQYVYFGGNLYVKGEVKTDGFVYYDAAEFFSPRAVFTLDRPIANRKAEDDFNDFCNLFQMIVEKVRELINPPDLPGGKEVAEKLAKLVNNQLMNHGYEQPPLIPDAVAIPLKSNVLVYGPWVSIGPPGQTKMEVDSGLVPWEYGTDANLAAAGLAKATANLTYMQVGEMGQISVPGFPSLGLGSELGYDPTHPDSGGLSLLETRQIITGEITLEKNGDHPQFIGYDPGTWTGLAGPNITGISCEIGQQGITTTYSMRTYTPKYNRFGKFNLDRIKKMGVANQKIARQLRMANFNVKNAVNAKIKQAQLAAFFDDLAKPKDKGGSPHNLLIAQLIKASEGSRTGVHVGHKTESVNEFTNNFSEKAIMSLDGLLRPFSQQGAGSLPKYGEPMTSSLTAPFAPLPHISREIEPPLTDLTPIDINRKFLDPFIKEGDEQHTNGDPSHHDIVSMAEGEEVPEEGNFDLPYDNEVQGEKYTGTANYRPLALRGPLVINGWGYDLDGKPVPNKSKNEDYFKDNWLQDPSSWPVGPLDLRWDSDRKVWTFPSGFRIVRAKLKNDLKASGSGVTEETNVDAIIVANDGNDIYKDDGTKVAAEDKKIKVYCPFFGSTGTALPEVYAKKDDIVVCYYNSVKKRYYALAMPGAGTSTTSSEVVHFRLTSDLDLRSSASAVILNWNGASFDEGDAITVWDWFTNSPGMFRGETGYEGIALYDGYSDYDIIWMEGKARSLEFELTGEPTGPTYTVKAKKMYLQGRHPVDVDEDISVEDRFNILKYSITGAKGIAIYDDYDDKYVVINVNQAVLFAQGTLGGDLCGDTATINAGATFIRHGDFNIPAAAISSADNPFKHKGRSGDAVLLLRKETNTGWIVIDVEKKTEDVVTLLSPDESGAIYQTTREVAVESCKVADDPVLLFDPTTLYPPGYEPSREVYVISFELFGDLSGSTGCGGEGVVAKINCSTFAGNEDSEVLWPQADYVFVYDDAGNFPDAITGCKGIAIIDWKNSPGSDLGTVIIGEEEESVDNGFVFTILECDQMCDLAIAKLNADMCTGSKAQFTPSNFLGIPNGRRKHPIPTAKVPGEAENPFNHVGKGGEDYVLVKKGNTGQEGDVGWFVIDAKKKARDILVGSISADDCEITYNKIESVVETCKEADTPGSTNLTLPQMNFCIYKTECEEGVLKSYKQTVYLDPCTGEVTQSGGWTEITEENPECDTGGE